jgi:hypothetical protein
MKAELFLDTGYVIALSVPNDRYHEQAVRLAEQIEENNIRLVTTHAILLEIGNALSKERYRPAAVKLIDSLENDPNVEIVPLSENLFSRAFRLYRERSDKEWGLIDCVSFVVMKDREITEALTSDEHYEQSGFRALLKEPSL